MRSLLLYLPALACAALMVLCMRKGHGGHGAGCEHKHDDAREHEHDDAREHEHDAPREHGHDATPEGSLR